MKFKDLDVKVSSEDIHEAEKRFGLKFPASLKRLFLESNGGTPDPYIFEGDVFSLAIGETLPLVSSSGRGTAIDYYKQLALELKLVASRFFPFATDPGGECFFVDTGTECGVVHFLRTDTAVGPNLVCLDVGLEEFWSALVEE